MPIPIGAVMPSTATLPFAGYVRVSKVAGRAGSSFISPAVQADTIRRLADSRHLELAEVVEELDASGGKSIDKRELGRLVKAIEDGQLGGLIVWKLSRFSRSLLDGVTVANRIEAADGRLIAEDYETGQPAGKAILGFMLGMAEQELDARRAGWNEAATRAAQDGRWPGRVPIGYVKNSDGRLEPSEHAEAITQAFNMRAEGQSVTAVARYIRSETGLQCTASKARHILRNVAYLGTTVRGELSVPDTHEPLISAEQWQLAQRRGVAPKNSGVLAGVGLLRGLIVCAGCGRPMAVTTSARGKGRVASYTCSSRQGRECPAPATIGVDKVDALVLPAIEKMLAAGAVDPAKMQAEYQAAEAVWRNAQAELDGFLAAGLVSTLGAELYAQEVTRRRESLEASIREFEAVRQAQVALFVQTDTIEERRAIARKLIESVSVRKSGRGTGRWLTPGERVELVWRAA